MTAKISIEKSDAFGIDKVGVPSRVNSPLNKNLSVPTSPGHQSIARTEVVYHSINLVHEAIRDENIQAAKSACDLKSSGVPLSLISNQLRLKIALSLHALKSTASSLGGVRTFLSGFLGPEHQ